MREIKFRQAIFIRGKFVYWQYWGFIGGRFRGVSLIISNHKEAQERSQQYTGLKDKNGKEIYEGDILRQGDKHIWSIKWSNEHGAYILGTNDPHEIKSPAWLDLEIIGNIYENPELIDKL